MALALALEWLVRVPRLMLPGLLVLAASPSKSTLRMRYPSSLPPSPALTLSEVLVRSALSDESRVLTVDMGDEDDDEEDVDDGPGVLRTADPIVALAPALAPVPPELPLTTEDGRDEAPMRSGRGGAPTPAPADRPARVALVVVWAVDAGPDGADAAAVPPAEAASLRRRRAARAPWADCFRAAGAEEVVSASILFINNSNKL